MITGRMTNSGNGDTTRGWDTYWKGARDAEAFTAGGVGHPGFASFWDGVLLDFLDSHADAKILDIASGSGAILDRLGNLSEQSLRNVTCVDISAAAVAGLTDRYPDIRAIVADANSIPLKDGEFDLVTSQFGIEYAGRTAVDEALRLLAADGTLILLLHIESGGIYRECAEALDAVSRMDASGFIDRALRFFDAGFAAVRGGDRLPYERAGAELNPSIRNVESILSDFGQHVAGGTIFNLYSHVQQIHGRIQYYDPEDVLGWLRTMRDELSQYAARMQSMCKAALDKKEFALLCENFESHGLNIAQAGPLTFDGSNLPMAWVLNATRAV